MADVDDVYYELLGVLVAADEAAGGPQTFVITFAGPFEAKFVGVVGVPDDARAPSDVEVDNMAELGWVRITHAQGKIRHFALRADGTRAWRKREAQLAHVPVPVDLDWTVARPLLKRVFDRYREAGGAEMAADMTPEVQDPEHGPETRALLFHLARIGFIEVVWEDDEGPRLVRPGIPALQMFAGWPVSAAQDVLDELTSAIDTEIERSADNEKRSKLIAVRDGLLGAARDVAIRYLETKIGAA